MAHATGTYSEHTAEYVLVPRIVAALRGVFSQVIPFYFWVSREGTSLSKLSAPISDLRLLAAFPRRPKLGSISSDTFLVRLNAELFDHAIIAESFGIPAVAGIPLARSVFDLNEEPTCSWFALAPQVGEPSDVFVWLDENGQLLAYDGPESTTVAPLSPEDIRDLVLHKAKPMTWEAAIHAIRESRRGRMTWRLPYWGGNRKPFHIACIDPLET